MAVSQNGWRANDRSLIKYWRAGRNQVLLSSRKGDVQTVMAYVANRFDAEVHTLVQKNGQWGYAERPIRGSRTTSNHASGTAIDLDAALHPLGTQPSANFGKEQLTAIRRIVNACNGVVRWGGDYHGRKDGMHFEINAGTAAVAALAKKIRNGAAPAGKAVAAAMQKDEEATVATSLGKTSKQAMTWRKWTAVTWNVVYASKKVKRNNTPGYVAPTTGLADDGIEELNIQGLDAAKGDQVQFRYVARSWDTKNKKAGSYRWVGMAADMTATPGGQFPSVRKRKSLKKGYHAQWEVKVIPGDGKADRAKPTVESGRRVIVQEG